MKPTIDCDNCNQDSVDENGKFYCKWNPAVKLIEGNRCYYVSETNKIYENAIKIRG